MYKHIFIYQTICLINGKSYIGVHGTNNMNDGYIGNGIYQQAGAKKNSPFHNAVKKYGYKNFKRYELCFFEDYETALEEERFIVDERWVKRNDNYNCALGGKGSPFLGMTDEKKKEIALKFTGEKSVKYGKAAYNRKKIIQYSLDNQFIASYDSITEASEKLNIYDSNIINCCKGKSIMSNGFIFRYENYSEEEKRLFDHNIISKQRIYNSDGSYVATDIVKSKMSKSRIQRKLPKHSELSKEKMRLSKLGKKTQPCSENTKLKIGNANRGRKLSETHKQLLVSIHKDKIAHNRKSILQFDLNGDYLNEYSSIRDASNKLNCNQSLISQNLTGRIKSCKKKYIFKYKEVNDEC